MWSSLWGHETLSWAGGTHVNTANGAVGGARCGATKRCPGLGRRMRTPPLGTLGGARCGATKR
eukprot:8308119-Pyramimonas_sp.AAC.1